MAVFTKILVFQKLYTVTPDSCIGRGEKKHSPSRLHGVAFRAFSPERSSMMIDGDAPAQPARTDTDPQLLLVGYGAVDIR